MESSPLTVTSSLSVNSLNSNFSSFDSRSSEAALVLSKTFDEQEDDNSAGLDDLVKGLTVTAREVVDKLNELLKAKLPGGLESLKPEDVTPEATAERIVQGSVGFYDVYAKQHPELQGEELLNSFLQTVRSGIDTGYADAYSTLDGVGAFEFDGVKEGVEKTKSLIEEKLKTFEAFKRKELGLDSPDVAVNIADITKSQILSQAGGRALNLIA